MTVGLHLHKWETSWLEPPNVDPHDIRCGNWLEHQECADPRCPETRVITLTPRPGGT